MRYIGLVFHAPMQSWGASNLADVNKESPRNTYLIPTKSAILGILRSSLGEARTEEEDKLDLKSSRILVRVDRQGSLARDYNIAQRTHHGFRAGTTKEIPKFFIQDATFVVLFGHSRPETVDALLQSLQSPMWAPFLGRRSHVPTLPLLLGEIKTSSPRETLENLPVFWSKDEGPNKTILYTDSKIASTDKIKEMIDSPNFFNPQRRDYQNRTYGQYSKRHDKPINTKSIIETYAELKEKVNNDN